MGLRSEIQAELAAALNDANLLGDISRAFEYEHPTTGVKTPGRGWRTRLSHIETDSESVQVGDLKFKCLTNELAVEPEIDGIIHLEGDEFYIYNVVPSSSDTTWTMYARG